MLSIRNILVATLIGLVVGFGGGYYTKSKFEKATVVERVVEQRKDDVAAVVQMQKSESALQSKIDSARSNISTIKKEIKRHEIYVSKPEIATDKVEKPNSPAPDCGERVLSVAAVGMLNAARANEPFDSSAWSNGKGEAPSGVTDEDFIDNDLEVVGMYHDLAKRHDALVDWVSETITKQNGKILAD